MIKKMPWGIIAGSCVMVFSFLTIAIVAVFVISNMMYAAVGSDDGLGESWWLILLYIGDVLMALGFAISYFFYRMKNKNVRRIK